MPVDPQVQVLLDALERQPSPLRTRVPPAEARAAYDSVPERAVQTAVAEARDHVIDGPGGKLRVRSYRPAGDGPFGLLLWFHGGGFVVGSIDSHDRTVRLLADRARCVAVSVGYRLAPESPFPAAAHDCYAATSWAVQHAARLGAQAGRVAVGGDSAGGNLAAAVALMGRDRRGPPLDFQLLVYPLLDFDHDRPSMRENADGYFLTRADVQWYDDQYAAPEDRTNPYAAPLRAPDLAGLPPAHVITAELDPLRDEGEAYAEALRAAGVPVTLTRYDGLIHGFLRMSAVVDRSLEACEDAAAAVRRGLGLGLGR